MDRPVRLPIMAQSGNTAEKGFMSIINQVRDLAVWAGEVCAPRADRLPRHALGMVDGQPVRLSAERGGYTQDRPAKPGDRFPIFVHTEQILAGTFSINDEAILHGSGPARIDLARRCPFPLEQAAWGLARKPTGWQNGAPWHFAALPRTRLDAMRAKLSEAGATPTGAFAVVDGAPVALTNAPLRTSRSLIAAGASATVAAVIAVASITYSTNRLEAEANARLDTARAALDEAEANAAAALAARTAASMPIEAAKAVQALLNNAPPAGAILAALTDATNDQAHVRRLRIAPGRIEGEFIAPDAAALAVALGKTAPFSSARLKTAARTDASTKLQAATLEIAVEPMQ